MSKIQHPTARRRRSFILGVGALVGAAAFFWHWERQDTSLLVKAIRVVTGESASETIPNDASAQH